MRPAAWSLIASGLFLWGCSTSPTFGPPSSGPSAPPPDVNSPLTTSPSPPPFELGRVTPQQVKALMDQGESVIIADVRGRASYELMHIEGAASLPARDFAVWGPTLNPEQTIVFY